MIRLERVIARFRRDLRLSGALKYLLLGGIVMAVLLQAPLGSAGLRSGGSILLLGVGMAWVLLSYYSAKGSRLIAESPALIAAGQFEEAERQIEAALQSFSLFRTVKLRSLHQLALLRHAQGRWNEAAALCKALLEAVGGERWGGGIGRRQQVAGGSDSYHQMPTELLRSTWLIQARALLEVGDVGGAYGALMALYQQRLTLGEALELVDLQLEYVAAVGSRPLAAGSEPQGNGEVGFSRQAPATADRGLWQQAMDGVGSKVELAELMPTAKAARVQAILALAARKTGQKEWERYLVRRVELLADVPQLIGHYPVLAELWEGGPRPGGGGLPMEGT